LSLATVGFIQTPVVSSSLLEEAEVMLKNVASGRYKSFYDHKNNFDGIEYRFNCYGFIDYLLATVSPQAKSTLKERMHTMKSDALPLSEDGIPCPFNLFAIFHSLKNHPDETWSTVELKDIKPGDILVYQPPKYNPMEKANYSKPTGTHVMVIQKVIDHDNQSVLQHLGVIHFSKTHQKPQETNSENTGLGMCDLLIRKTSSTTTYQVRWAHEETWYKKVLAVGRLTLPKDN